jgi:galacturan 1,4-alpha-galacturonidase
MARPKIAFVGGGSYSWASRIIRDTISLKELSNADVRLLDLDSKAAETVAAITRRYAEAYKAKATFKVTTDMAEAFDGADFIIITISTGGFDAMAHDLKIPDRYGVYQTVGDSTGPGGWARGLRNIPVFIDIALKAREYCPNAFILNYTNPMATLTKTLTTFTDQPVVGLCHGMFENLRQLQRIFRLKGEDQLRAKYAGMNHFFWMFDFSVKGQPGMPMLKRKLRGGKTLNDVMTDYVDEAGHSSPARLVASELFELYGAIPYFGDRHTTEFFTRYLTDKKMIDKYGIKRTTIAMRRRGRAKQIKWAEAEAAGKRKLVLERSRETAADIMHARVTGAEFVDVMNLPNVGQIDNLPRGPVVETAGMVNGTGFHPIAVGEMPNALANLCMPHALNNELIVEAGIEGDWDKAYHALMNDPLCARLPLPKIKEMGRKLLEANKKYLPQFFGKGKRH